MGLFNALVTNEPFSLIGGGRIGTLEISEHLGTRMVDVLLNERIISRNNSLQHLTLLVQQILYNQRYHGLHNKL